MILNTKVGPFSIGLVNGELVSEFSSILKAASPPEKWVKLLRRYFAGEHVDFSQVPLPNGSPFVQQCWIACRNIPYGETITYGELARSAGSPRAARAAGQAMRRNPLPVMTPCHRVIAASGKLHGFAGKTAPNSKELRTKRYLLALEQPHFERV